MFLSTCESEIAHVNLFYVVVRFYGTGHKQPLSVEYILQNRLRMAVLNGMVFSLIYLIKVLAQSKGGKTGQKKKKKKGLELHLSDSIEIFHSEITVNKVS